MKKSQLTTTQRLQGAISLTVALMLFQSLSLSTPFVQKNSAISFSPQQPIHFLAK